MSGLQDRPRQGSRRILYSAAAAVLFLFVAELLGEQALAWLGSPPDEPVHIAAFAAVALVLGAIATVMIDRVALAPLRAAHATVAAMQAAEDARVRQADADGKASADAQRKLRHDLRGAISPVLLIADRLLNHADPAVQRAGNIAVASVNKATALLDGPAPLSPPGGP